MDGFVNFAVYYNKLRLLIAILVFFVCACVCGGGWQDFVVIQKKTIAMPWGFSFELVATIICNLRLQKKKNNNKVYNIKRNYYERGDLWILEKT